MHWVGTSTLLFLVSLGIFFNMSIMQFLQHPIIIFMDNVNNIETWILTGEKNDVRQEITWNFTHSGVIKRFAGSYLAQESVLVVSVLVGTSAGASYLHKCVCLALLYHFSHISLVFMFFSCAKDVHTYQTQSLRQRARNNEKWKYENKQTC